MSDQRDGYLGFVARAAEANARAIALEPPPSPALFGDTPAPGLSHSTERPRLLEVSVPGKPRPQGSMTMWTAGDGSTRSKYPPEVVAHRNLVVATLARAWVGRGRLDEALAIRCVFMFARPGSHYGTGKNSQRLKPSAPQHHLQAPDTDKLCRLVCDALTVAQVWRDDCLAVSVQGRKVWAPSNGTRIELLRAGDAL